MIISSFKDVFRLLKLSEVCIILQGGTKAERLKPRANGRNIVGKQLPTLLGIVAFVCT